MYTPRKVFGPLAAKLPVATPSDADIVRFSVVGDAGGIAAQRAAHFSIYGSDAAVAKIRAFPDEAWDPDTPQAGEKYGIVWIRLRDLHHNAVGDDPIAAVVLVDDHLFVSITLSSTTKHIRREDGEDENGVTRLILALLNHYPSLRSLRWADDVTRAGRDAADWALIKSKCKVRAVVMVFGGQPYDQSVAGDELALGALGLVGADDDPRRRRKLTGKRLMKYKLGGAAIAEMQMPHGWNHTKDKHGRPIIDGDRGLVPEADPAMTPVFQALYAAHASGETYQRIAERMVGFEADGLLRRRDHTNLDNTYALTCDDPLARYDAAKNFFVRSNFRPKVAPSQEAISRYLDGEDPADVFDAETRLFLAKVELLRTGRYFRRLTNDIRGRNIVLDGIPATYRDDLDEYGWFDVLSAHWAWPTDAVGQELPSFGLTDETCRKVAARLLLELRAPKAPTGGRAHQSEQRRVLQAFDNWTVTPGHADARYEDEPTEWGVEARCNNNGKENFILLFRRQSVGVSARGGRRGWGALGEGERKPDHIAATGSLPELAASVAVHLDAAVRRLLDPAQIATVTQTKDADAADPTVPWKSKADRLRGEAKTLGREAAGHRTMAALMTQRGDTDEAGEYATQAADAATRQRDTLAKVATLEARIAHQHAEQRDRSGRDDQGDVSAAAYLVAGLEHSSRNGGRAPAALAKLCDQSLTAWRFTPEGEDIHWSCTCLIPLTSGGTAELPLAGVIRNVRTRCGKSLATTETVIRYLFQEGRDLDDVAQILEVTRKTLLTQRVMPWLVTHGITSRGAKCALVDHPLQSVRREVHARLEPGALQTDPTEGDAYRSLLLRTYLDPDLQWGDAAVPDDTTWIARALRLATKDGEARKDGVRVLDVALALGRSEDEVRALVQPTRRTGGFTRPRYLAYADQAKTRVKTITCPHTSCRGRTHAQHVVLLPEVSASGYGVICGNCRRVPIGDSEWSAVQFPADYLRHWTNRGRGGSLRLEAQTVPVRA